MTDFGWQYPPGAASDPRAPWNQGDPLPLICDDCSARAEEGAIEGDPCSLCGGDLQVDSSRMPCCWDDPRGCYCDHDDV